MPSSSRFDPLNSFLRRHHKLIIVAWVIAVIVASTQISVFFGAVSYNVAGSNFGGPTNAESEITQKIMNSQFPSMANSSDDGIIVVLQNAQVHSTSVQSAVLTINRTLATDPSLSRNFTGMSSIYSTEYSLLAPLLPPLVQQVSQLNSTVAASQPARPLTAQQSWDVASGIVANATAQSFSASPLFKVDAEHLGALLASLRTAASPSQDRAIALGVLSNETYPDYPLVLSRSLTQNFVSPDNGTMIVVYNFASPPSASMIAVFRDEIANSSIPSLGTYYVTGGAVLTQDVSNVFGPVVGITVAPGVLAALAIVGIMLLAPLAAIVPVLIGGVAIVIALPTIYYGVVVVGHGTLTFLTPALAILLTLGLAVDYSVLQLRRTKEERTKGKSVEESVSTSVRWAGQAVLTAGVTVVVAYIVMAVANVPLFSGVGTAIAAAVSILVLAALTLLPALELTLKDRLFWPGLNRGKDVKRTKTRRINSLSETTLRRRVGVIVVISALALGAFYVAESTPSGANILKLFPNFPSNAGLSVITAKLGSSATAPTSIIVTTPSLIVSADGQLNETLLKAIELVSMTASSVPGVATTSGPTRPYGSPFNYTGVSQLSAPVRAQYLAGMRSYIGLNNETASIVIGFQSDGQSQAAVNTLLKVEKAISSLPLLKGVAVYYGGETQSTYDNQSFLNGILPEVVAILGVAVYVILLIQLRSVFTPIRLIFTILCSVAFSMALLVVSYSYAQGLPILDFAPLFVVVTMLGVGIDYDIFFVTRIREEVLNGDTDRNAIMTALDRVWVTIFGLGLVLATVFTSLIVTGIALLGEIGFVVAAAVLVDVGIVILFFVPALMAVAQRFNWWPTKVSNSRSEEQ